MSSTPPRKGKKRQAPQTPTGRPPAKASRPSSPTASHDDFLASEAERLRQHNPSAFPAIPPFRPKSGRKDTRTPSPVRRAPAAPMDEDSGPTSPVDDPLAFTTVETEIDDDEAASSFKELLDWMRYLAQHQGQRERLLDLLTTAASSLQDLLGSGGCMGMATYAAAVATSAPQPRVPKKATPAPTTKKHIQHAITRFEHVSRELPGAPRDTLLNIVAKSDLKTTPPCFPPLQNLGNNLRALLKASVPTPLPHVSMTRQELPPRSPPLHTLSTPYSRRRN